MPALQSGAVQPGHAPPVLLPGHPPKAGSGMITVVANLKKSITLDGVVHEETYATVMAHRGYPEGGGEDIVILSISRPDQPTPEPAKAEFTVDEFRDFVRVLGFVT
jgi:hypothetical protein